MLRASLVLASAVALLAGPETAAPADHDAECVILMHGLGRGAGSMRKLERRLQESGYLTWNDGYPSRREPIEALSAHYVGEAVDACQASSAEQIHFVTHSMGGILVRQYLQSNAISTLGRIVMLSPPNQGSEVAEELGDSKLVQWLLGPAVQQLGTGENSLPLQLGPVPGEIGVITGTRSFEPWFSSLLPGEDDGKVSVRSAQLDGMRDFMAVPSVHGLIMRDSGVIEQVVHFLEHGRFDGGLRPAARAAYSW